LEDAHRDLVPAFSAANGTLFRWKASARADGPANGTTFRWRPRIAISSPRIPPPTEPCSV